VLVGSTEKMGVGTNVQARAVALHHLDCPWRPADVAQRGGRILRQGNLNTEVQIFRYVTERSFDGYMWQTVERKARFIAQVMRGRLDVREIEDIGDAALSYNEVKALATGNPLLMDKAEADAELTRLERAERAHHRNHDTLRYKITSAEKRIERLTALTGDIDAAIGRRRDTRGDAFAMILDGVTYSKRSHAGVRLMQFLERETTALARSSHPRIEERPGHLGGFDVTTATSQRLGTTQVTIALDGVPESEIWLIAKDLADMDPAGLVIRLENRLTGLETLKAKTLNEIDRLGTESARAREDTSKPFPQADQLAAARDRARQIDKQLAKAARPSQPDEHDRPAGAVTQACTRASAAKDATRGSAPTGDAKSADGTTTVGAVNGAPHSPTLVGQAIPLRRVPAGTGSSQPPEAVSIARRGFPEHNPLAPAESAATAISRPMACQRPSTALGPGK
jgi:hypothetical protein